MATSGFSSEFKGWGLEDCELGYKLSREGCELLFDKDNFVFHQHHQAEFDINRFEGWLLNLNKFMAIHNYEPEVVLQKVLALSFDPRVHLPWIDCYERFELAVRIAKGHLSPSMFRDVLVLQHGS